MANCLFECLREAKLEQYYPNFEANGVTRSEGLTTLTMQEYSNYGIDDMDDRKRLFQLIQIIKSVQNHGKKCRRSCESCQDEGSARSASERTSPESASSPDDLHQEYNTSANRNVPPLLNNHVMAKKLIKTNNNNVMSYSLMDKVDNKPEMFFVQTRVSSPKKSKPRSSQTNALRQSLSDSETVESRQDHRGPKLRDRTAEVINYAGVEYNYGVPSAHPRAAPTSNYASHTLTSAMPVDRIQVCVRKRPLSKKEKRNKEADVIQVENPRKVVLNERKTAVDLTKFIQLHEFYFDEVFDENQSNEQIYEKTAKPLVDSIFKGGKATCFAYGQTGAGKTHTMLGNDKVQGLYLLAARDIFSLLYSGHHGRNLSVWASYFEIYCGQLFDLLNGRKRLHAREDGKNNVCIAGIKEFQIGNVAALMEAIEFGNQVRSTGCSGVNADSSRSHAILQIQLRDKSKRKVGRFSFIDLAGSERASDTNDPDRITRMEGAEINTSLLALKECIRAIDQEQRHTPFRQSKLTHILKESFLGNSRTCMIANISPNSNASEHTLNTLRYANRVKELKKDSVTSSGGSPNSASYLPRAPSIFSPSNTSTPKRKFKPSPLSRESENWESSQSRTFQPYSVPKARPSRENKPRRKNSSPEDDNRSLQNGVGSSRVSLGTSRISIGIDKGDTRLESGDIRVVKYSPHRPSSNYFSTPVSSRASTQATWEIDNPRFAPSQPTVQSSPTSPAKSESSVRLSVDKLKSDSALRKSKEFWVVRNDSSSVRNLLMDSSPEGVEDDEGEEAEESDSDSTNTDNTSEIIQELDRILEQSWIRNSSSGNSSYQHLTRAERPDEGPTMSGQRVSQTSHASRRQEGIENTAGDSTRPVCDLRVPEKPDVEENGHDETSSYSLRELASANTNGYHTNESGKVKVSKKSRKRWVADANISRNMAREIESLPSPKDFLKSLAQAKAAEKQKPETPKKTSPSGVIVATDFQECFMPTQLKYTPEPGSDTDSGSQRPSGNGLVHYTNTNTTRQTDTVGNAVTQEYVPQSTDQAVPQLDRSGTGISAGHADEPSSAATSEVPVEVLATQTALNSRDRIPPELTMLVPYHQLPSATDISMPLTTTTITTITTTVSTTTFPSPRKPDSNHNFTTNSVTSLELSPQMSGGSPAKANVIKLSPRMESSQQAVTEWSRDHNPVLSQNNSQRCVHDDQESCASGGCGSETSCGSQGKEKDNSPAGSDILTPSSQSAFTPVQPRAKAPAQPTTEQVPKTRACVMPSFKAADAVNSTVKSSDVMNGTFKPANGVNSTLKPTNAVSGSLKQAYGVNGSLKPAHAANGSAKPGNAVNGTQAVQGERSAYFAPVKKEYALACSFPQDELRDEINQALATSSIRSQNEALLPGLDVSQSSFMTPEKRTSFGHVMQTPDEQPTYMSRRNSAMERAKDLMLSAHEEQIIEMGQLSNKEYQLIKQVKNGDQDFNQFVERLDELLFSKIRCIETLRSQLEAFSESTTPRKK